MRKETYKDGKIWRKMIKKTGQKEGKKEGGIERRGEEEI